MFVCCRPLAGGAGWRFGLHADLVGSVVDGGGDGHALDLDVVAQSRIGGRQQIRPNFDRDHRRSHGRIQVGVDLGVVPIRLQPLWGETLAGQPQTINLK